MVVQTAFWYIRSKTQWCRESLGLAVKHKIIFSVLDYLALKNLFWVCDCTLFLLHGRVPFCTECFEKNTKIEENLLFFSMGNNNRNPFFTNCICHRLYSLCISVFFRMSMHECLWLEVFFGFWNDELTKGKNALSQLILTHCIINHMQLTGWGGEINNIFLLPDLLIWAYS